MAYFNFENISRLWDRILYDDHPKYLYTLHTDLFDQEYINDNCCRLCQTRQQRDWFNDTSAPNLWVESQLYLTENTHHNMLRSISASLCDYMCRMEDLTIYNGEEKNRFLHISEETLFDSAFYIDLMKWHTLDSSEDFINESYVYRLPMLRLDRSRNYEETISYLFDYCKRTLTIVLPNSPVCITCFSFDEGVNILPHFTTSAYYQSQNLSGDHQIDEWDNDDDWQAPSEHDDDDDLGHSHRENIDLILNSLSEDWGDFTPETRKLSYLTLYGLNNRQKFRIRQILKLNKIDDLHIYEKDHEIPNYLRKELGFLPERFHNVWDLSNLTFKHKNIIQNIIPTLNLKGITIKNGVEEIKHKQTQKQRDINMHNLRDLKNFTNMDDDDFVAQVWNPLTSIKNQYNNFWNFISSIEEMPGKLNDLIDQVSTLITDVVTGIKDKIQSWTCLKDWLVFLVVSSILLLVPAKFYKFIYVGFTILCLALTTLEKNFSSIILSQVKTSFGDTNSDDSFVPQSSADFLPTFFFTISSMFLIHKIPFDKTINLTLSRLDSVPRAINGIERIWNYFSNWIPQLKTFFYRVVMQDTTYVPTVTEFQPVNDWLNKCMRYNDIEAQQILKMNKPEVIAMSTLYNEGLTLSAQCAKEHWGGEVQSVIGKGLVLAKHLYTIAESTGVIASSTMRDEPTCVCLAGQAGVGKSYLTKYLASYIMAKEGISRDNIISNMYYINTDNEFYDAYNGQFTAIFDDFAQKVDSQSNPNLDFFELIRCQNTATYPLHMATLGEKGNVYFNSKLIMLSTNISHFNEYIHSINEKEAIRRRIDLPVYVVVKPQYRVDSNPNLNPFIKENSSKCKIDINKLPKNSTGEPDMCLDIWNFHRYNPMTGEIYKDASSIFDFRSLCKQALTTARNKGSKSVAFNNNIKNFVDNLDSFDAEVHDEFHVAESFDKYGFDGTKFPRTYQYLTIHYPLGGNYLEDETYQRIFKQESTLNVASAIYSLKDINLYEEISCKLAVFSRLYKQAFNYIIEFKNKVVQMYKDFTEKYPMVSTILKYSSFILGSFTAAFGLYSLCTSAVDVPKKEKAEHSGTKIPVKKFANDFKFVPDCYKHLVKDSAKTFSFNTEGDTVLYFKSPYTCMHCSGRRYCFLDEFPRCLDCRNIFDALLYKDNVRVLYNGGKSNIIIPEFFRAQTQTHKPYLPKFSAQAHERSPNYQISVTNLVASNLLDIQFIYEGGRTRKINNCLMVSGHLGVINRHALYIFENQRPLKIKFSSLTLKDGFEIFADEFRYEPVLFDGKPKDLAFFTLPIDSIRFRDITKHFISETDYQKFPIQNSDITGSLITHRGDCMIYNTYVSAIRRSDVNHFAADPAKCLESQYIHHNIRYNANTSDGDCGSPILIDNVYFQSTICGLHIGSQKGSVGLATVITKEIIDIMKTKFDKLSVVAISSKDIDSFEAQSYDTLLNLPDMPEGNFIPLFQCSKKISQSPINKIVPSEFIDKLLNEDGSIHYHEKLPSLLSTTRDDDGNKIRLLQKGLSKMGIPSVRIPKQQIDEAVASFKNKFMHLNPEWSERSILTFEQAVQGVEYAEFDNGMNRSSSPGFPYNAFYKLQDGKKSIFGDDEWKFDTPMAIELRQRNEKYQEDYRTLTETPLFVTTDTEKMEKLPIQKILDKKTRVFSAGNVDFYIIFRQYFGSFLNMMKKNRIIIESCVGINPYSMDATLLADELLSKGNEMLAGDFSRFDATVNGQILYAVVEMINDWYNDEHSEIRLALAQEIINSVHIAGNSGYMWTHSQPSGQPATAEFNCLYTSLAMRIVVNLIAPYPVVFNDLFNFKTYGDDTIISFNASKIGDWFNYQTVSAGFTQIGMEYTEETKTQAIVKWKTIDEITFLKRHIVYNTDLGRWTMPLFKSTIYETVYWHPKSRDQRQQLVSNCLTSLGEASLHGKQFYDFLAKQIRLLCNNSNLQIEIPHFNYFLQQLTQGCLLECQWTFSDLSFNHFDK